MGQNVRLSEANIVNAQFGENVHVIKPVNLYGCELSSDVFVGPLSRSNLKLKLVRDKIQSHVFICSLVEIGCDCFIGHGVVRER